MWTSQLNPKRKIMYIFKSTSLLTQMYSMYHTFNFLTGYTQENPSVQSIEWRLIVLESVAGVPGFVAAGKEHTELRSTQPKATYRIRTNRNIFDNINIKGFRHFRSLRTLERDHGWIATLLEEAENERMHLLLCLNKFQAGEIAFFRAYLFCLLQPSNVTRSRHPRAP